MSLQAADLNWARRSLDALVEQVHAWNCITPELGWVRWHGGICPVPNVKPFGCEFRLRDGEVHQPTERLDWYSWTHTGEATDIVAFRLIDT